MLIFLKIYLSGVILSFILLFIIGRTVKFNITLMHILYCLVSWFTLVVLLVFALMELYEDFVTFAEEKVIIEWKGKNEIQK
jgi:hypothetical protein